MSLKNPAALMASLGNSEKLFVRSNGSGFGLHPKGRTLDPHVPFAGGQVQADQLFVLFLRFLQRSCSTYFCKIPSMNVPSFVQRKISYAASTNPASLASKSESNEQST